MAATTTLLGLVTPTQGTLSGTWGDTVNYGITDYVDISVAGTLTLTGDGAVTLANTTGSSSGNSITSTLAGAGTVTAQFSAVRVSGTTTTKVVTGPSYSKTYLLDNASSYAVTFKASGQTGVSISPGEKVYVYYNATDYVKVGGGGITYGAVKTTTYTAVANDGVLTNTTGGAFTVNLPATPSTGTQVFIADANGTWGTNNLTIGRNGSTIAGSATDLVCDINSVSIQCIYDGTTWDIFAQIGANNTAVVTLTGTQTLTNKTLTSPTITSPTITGTGTIAAATVTLSSTLAVTGVATLSADALVNGLTVGRGAGAVSTNTAVGASALAANTSGSSTSAFGASALASNTSGTQNTGLGYYALQGNTTGSANTGVGYGAGYQTTTGSNNTSVGQYALQANTTASGNTAVGYQAGYFVTGASNSVLGYQAGYAITTGTFNTAIGRESMGYNNVSGDNSTAVGGNALNRLTTGNNNTAVGYGALYANTTASQNTAVGYNALTAATTGGSNTAVGRLAGKSITTAVGNALFGENAGAAIVSATGNAFFGREAGIFATGGGNTSIGPQDSAAGYNPVFDLAAENNRIVMGHTSITNAYVKVAWTVTSDARDKTNIVPITLGLDFVKQLNPVSYNFKVSRTDDTPIGNKRYGFLAQDILALEGDNPVIIDNEKPEHLKYQGESLVPILVKAIQELKADFDAYKASHP